MKSVTAQYEIENAARVRDILKKEMDRRNIRSSQLIDGVSKKTGVVLNDKTLYSLLGDDCEIINFGYLAFICNYLGLDINKLLFPNDEIKPNGADAEHQGGNARSEEADKKSEERPEDNQREATNHQGEIYSDIPFDASMRQVRDKYVVLPDADYAGTYYGYFAPESRRKKTPNKFTLKIEKDETTGMKATMTTSLVYKEKDGEDRYTKEIYHGVPVLSKASDIIVIFMVNNENGDFRQICFSYEKYKDGMGLLYRQGILLSGDQEHKPDLGMQSCLLFTREIDESKNKLLLGMLKVPNHTFGLSVEKAQRLASQNDQFAEFMNKHGERLQRKEVYVVREDSIINAVDSSEQPEVIEAVLLMKQESELVNVFHYRAKYRYRKFALSDIAEVKFNG